MSALFHRPLVLVAVAYAAGIAGAGTFLLFLSVIAAACVSGYLVTRASGSRTPFFLILVCTLAGAAASFASLIRDPLDVSRFARGTFVTLRGTVCDDVERSGLSVRTELAVNACELPDEQSSVSRGRVLLRLPADTALPDYGDRLMVRGRLDLIDGPRNPDAFDYRAYQARRGVYASLNVRRAGDLRVEQAEGSRFDLHTLVHRMRSSLKSALAGALSPTEASLAAGVLIGARTDIPAALEEDFTVTSTAHILATAGLHVGLVAALVLGTLRLLRVHRKPASAITIVALILYALVAEGRPSVMRAALMASLFLLGYCLDREGDSPNALAAAALILLIVSPVNLYDAGFQLSFATVGTIFACMALARPWLDRLRPPRGVRTSRTRRIGMALRHYAACVLVLSTAAQLGSAPLVAEYFNQVSLIGIAANTLVVPALIFVLAGGFAVWGISFVWPWAAKLIAALYLSPLLAYVIGGARLSADVPGAVVYVRSPGWLLIAAYYCLLGYVLYRIHVRTRQASAHEFTASQPARAEAFEVA